MSDADERNGWEDEDQPRNHADGQELGGPGTTVMSYEQQPAPPAPRVSAPSAPVEFRDFSTFVERIAGSEAVEQSQALMEAYDVACKALIGPNDVQKEGNREFKKKSAWRKLGRHFFISVKEVVEPHGRWERLPHDDAPHYVAFARVEATAPWGQSMPGFGACSTRELRFYMTGPACPKCGGPMWDNRGDERGPEDFACKNKGGCGGVLMEGQYEEDEIGKVPNPTARAKAEHDCLATAETRAINRAISELIAMGEVSWEEVQGGDEDAYTGSGDPYRGRGGNGRQAPTLDDPIGWGQHKGMTWREVAEQEPDYAWWLVTDADKPPKAIKSALEELLNQLSEEGAQDQAGEEDQRPQGDPLDGKPGSGKYGDQTWGSILATDPEYLEKMLARPWGEERAPAGSLLRARLDTGLETGKKAPGWRDTVNHLLDRGGATEEEARFYARLVPELPDQFSDWTEDHGQFAARQLVHHGVAKVLEGVRRRMDKAAEADGGESGAQVAQEPKEPVQAPEPDPLPKRLVDEARSVIDHATNHDLPNVVEAATRIEAAIKARDRETLVDETDALKTRLFAHMAGDTETTEDERQEVEEDLGEEIAEVQDDLPF